MSSYPYFLNEMTNPGSPSWLEEGQNPGVLGEDTWPPGQGHFLLLAMVQEQT